MKENANPERSAAVVDEIRSTLDNLHEHAPELATHLRNRAFTVSVVLLAWHLGIAGKKQTANYETFITTFLGRQRSVLNDVKAFRTPDDRYRYMIDFQRNLTQAAVEKPAVNQRHATLLKSWELFVAGDGVEGDIEYRKKERKDPPTA